MTRRLSFLLAVVVCLLVALPAVASADTYCVAPASGCDHSDSTVAGALSDAAAHPGADTIVLGATTYTTDGYAYAGNATNPVVIEGAGVAATTLATMTAGDTLLSASGGASVTVENLTAAIDGGPSVSPLAFNLDGPADVIANVAVVNGATGGRNVAGATENGGSLTMTHTSIALDTGVSGNAVSVNGGAALLADDTITGDFGISASGASVRVERSTVTATTIAIQNTPGSSSLGSLFVDDSVVGSANGADLVNSQSFNSGSSVTTVLRHDTLVGSGGGRAVLNTSGGGPATMTIDSTVFRNVTTSIDTTQGGMSPPGTATTSIDYSDYDPTTINTSGDTTVIQGPHSLVNLDPKFVSGSDFRLQASSPLINAGNPALDPAESTTDRDGNSRVVDTSGACNGISDIGAFEFQHFQAHAAATAAPGALTGQPVTFDASQSCDAAKFDPLTYSWKFDDGTTATGAVVQHAFATAGPHSGVVTVTDTGGSSATASASTVITSPPPPVLVGGGTVPLVLPPPFAGAVPGASRTFTVSGKNGTFVWSFFCPQAAVGGCGEQLAFTVPPSSLKLIAAKKKKPKTTVIARSNFHVNPGQTRRVTIKLSKQALAALRKHHKLKTTVTIVSSDGAGHTRTTTLTVTLKLGH